MIWILGGTSEVNVFLDGLVDQDYLVTVATESGLKFTKTNKVRVGRLNKEEMVQLIREEGIDVLVDLTHPYADIVSRQAREVAEEEGISYYRYIRPEIDSSFGYQVKDIEECCQLLKSLEGPVFFTTGSKNIVDFEQVRGKNRFIYRILPTSESIKIAEDQSVSYKDLVAMLGPFSLELNRTLFRQFKVRYCVTKESGQAGGQAEKLKACQLENVTPIVIKRQVEEGGFHDLKALIDVVNERDKKER